MGHTTGHKSVDFASIMADSNEHLFSFTGPIIDTGATNTGHTGGIIQGTATGITVITSVTGIIGATGITGVTATSTIRGRDALRPKQKRPRRTAI